MPMRPFHGAETIPDKAHTPMPPSPLSPRWTRVSGPNPSLHANAHLSRACIGCEWYYPDGRDDRAGLPPPLHLPIWLSGCPCCHLTALSLLHYGGPTAFAHLPRSGYSAPPHNHSTCSTFIPFLCSDYMTAPIIKCYIYLRPPSTNNTQFFTGKRKTRPSCGVH